MPNPRLMRTLRFKLYAALRYFDKRKPPEGTRIKKVEKKDLPRYIPPAEKARLTGENLTTLYRWEDTEKASNKARQERVSKMLERIESHLENEGKDDKAFQEDLLVTCVFLHLFENTASVRVLWELTEVLSEFTEKEEVQKAIQGAAAPEVLRELAEKEEVNEKIKKAIRDAADTLKLDAPDPDALKTQILHRQILRRLKAIQRHQ